MKVEQDKEEIIVQELHQQKGENVAFRSKKLLLVIVLLLLLLIITAAVFAGIQIGKRQSLQTPSKILFNQPTIQATPTPDLTREWNVYTNKKHNFSLKYPPDWEINLGPISEGKGRPMTYEEIEISDEISIFDTASARDKQTRGNANEIIIVVNGDVFGNKINCTGFTLEDCVYKLVKPYASPFTDPTPFSANFCGGKECLERTIVDSPTGDVGTRDFPGIKTTKIYFMNGEKIVSIHLIVENWTGRYEAARKIFDQILVTFKFLE